MNIKQLSLLSFFIFTFTILLTASENDQNLLCFIKHEQTKATTSYNATCLAIEQIPVCQTYLYAPKNINEKDYKKARDNFYKTKEGKDYYYWKKKLACFKAMLQATEIDTKKDFNNQKIALKKGVAFALFTDNNFASIETEVTITHTLDQELNGLIDDTYYV